MSEVAKGISNDHHSMQQVENLIRLVKKGDFVSLTKLRHQLGKTAEGIANEVGVSVHQFRSWELGEKQPSNIWHAFWKLRLSDYIDDAISTLLGTDNAEIVTKFWEIMWRLND